MNCKKRKTKKNEKKKKQIKNSSSKLEKKNEKKKRILKHLFVFDLLKHLAEVVNGKVCLEESDV